MALAIRVRVAVFDLLMLISLVVLQQKGDAQELIKLQNPRLKKCRFDKIYQLGDSLSDTGNCIRESLCGANSACSRLPYGMTLFQKATGRCSDGMLMIDFIAVESGLPLLNPYKDRIANFSHGADFAVAGATALSAEFLAEKMNIATSFTNSSLSVQLDWMDSHFKSTCSPDCPKYLEKSLFLVGEIGDEFNYAVSQGKTLDDLRRMVPDVVQAITDGVKRIIGYGATRIVVPGNFPVGCLPVILTNFRINNSTAYDEHHCLKDWNNFIIFFNNYLRQAIDEVKKEYPNIILIYADYYNAYLWLLQNAVTLGKCLNVLFLFYR
ncbi:unnamed protein product [Withania somnifera]